MSKKSQGSLSVLQIILPVLGTLIVAYLGYLGVQTQVQTPIHATQTAEARINEAISSTAESMPIENTPTSIPPRPIFSETFDNNNANWDIGSASGDEITVSREISDGKLYRTMESNETSDGEFGTVPIPNVFVKDFCLIFDARISESTSESGIVVVARAVNWYTDGTTYYYIRFENSGNGSVWFDPADKSDKIRRIAAFSENISWSDKNIHTVKVSLQGNILEVYDAQRNILLSSVVLDNNILIDSDGEIRIGTKLFGPNEKVSVEFDNIYVYDKCP